MKDWFKNIQQLPRIFHQIRIGTWPGSCCSRCINIRLLFWEAGWLNCKNTLKAQHRGWRKQSGPTRRHRGSGSLGIAFSGLGSGLERVYVLSTHFSSLPIFQHSTSSLRDHPKVLLCHFLGLWWWEINPLLYFFRFIFCFTAHNNPKNHIQCSSVPADLSLTIKKTV